MTANRRQRVEFLALYFNLNSRNLPLLRWAGSKCYPLLHLQSLILLHIRTRLHLWSSKNASNRPRMPIRNYRLITNNIYVIHIRAISSTEKSSTANTNDNNNSSNLHLNIHLATFPDGFFSPFLDLFFRFSENINQWSYSLSPLFFDR